VSAASRAQGSIQVAPTHRADSACDYLAGSGSSHHSTVSHHAAAHHAAAPATLTVLASLALGGQPSISVEHAWSRATPVGANVAVGYFTIKNNGATPDRLISITTDIASHSTIHQMSMTDSMMKMRQVTEGLPVQANGAVVLEPGSYHLMFNDLKRPLRQGEHFSATLVFEKAGKVDVTFEVQGLGAGAPKDY
jgi:periplasmic copper chaperone A